MFTGEPSLIAANGYDSRVLQLGSYLDCQGD